MTRHYNCFLPTIKLNPLFPLLLTGWGRPRERLSEHPMSAPLMEPFLKTVKFLSLVIVENFTNHPKIVLYDSPYLRLASPADLTQSLVRVPDDLSDFGLLCLCQVEIV